MSEMHRAGTVCSPPVTGQRPVEILRLLATAARELDRHVRDGDKRCRACRAPWPCPRACLAACALEAV
ncbi:MAG TPA: hypothetical protein VGL63_11085 [Streptosporangiaceae bacterium]|jgi:hypothetical protein